MTNALAIDIASRALALRQSHPWAPALDLLDLVMRGHEGTQLEFGPAGMPPERFALIVAEAFDAFMTPLEWASFTHAQADPLFRAGVLQIWVNEIWPRFVARYSLRDP